MLHGFLGEFCSEFWAFLHIAHFSSVVQISKTLHDSKQNSYTVVDLEWLTWISFDHEVGKLLAEKTDPTDCQMTGTGNWTLAVDSLSYRSLLVNAEIIIYPSCAELFRCPHCFLILFIYQWITVIWRVRPQLCMERPISHIFSGTCWS